MKLDSVLLQSRELLAEKISTHNAKVGVIGLGYAVPKLV